MRVLVALSLLVSLGACESAGMRFQFIDMERPPQGLGLPPPNDDDYKPCYSGRAEGLDTNGDGKPDVVRVTSNGHEVCHGSDSNHDGKIDTWDVMDEHGNLAKRAHDTNGDGRPDEAWTFDPTNQGCATIALDANGDGKADPGSPVDVCRGLSGKGSTPDGGTGGK